MTKLLIRLFIRDPANIQDRTVRTAYGNLACMVGIVCNVLLFAGKFTVGTLFGSMAIAADALNNLSDASSNVVSLVGFRLGSKPADDEHPYGHARYEYLAGLAVSVMILVIGIELLKESFLKVLHPTPVTLSALTIAVLVVSILVKLWMSSFNRSVGSRIKSETLMATAADARNDVVTTAAVLAATILAHLTGIDRIDGLMGVGVALFILWSGVGLVRDTISPLLGAAPDPELIDYIEKKALSYPAGGTPHGGKMKLKLYHAAAAAAMALSVMLLTACGSPKQADPLPIIKLRTVGSSSEAACQRIGEALSELTAEKFEFTVEISQQSTTNYNAELERELLLGKEPDVFCYTDAENMFSLAADGTTEPLDDWLEEFPTLKEAVSQDRWNCMRYDGKLIAVPGNNPSAVAIGFEARTDVLDELGIDAASIHTMDDMHALLLAAKQQNPSSVPLVPHFGQTLMMLDCDPLNNGLGVLLHNTGTEVVNLYDTPEYEELCNQMHQWYTEGLILKDAPLINAPNTRLMQMYGGVAFSHRVAEQNVVSVTRSTKQRLTSITLGSKLQNTSVLNIGWCISSRSEHKREGMQLLQYLYTDREAADLLLYGVEGVDYRRLDVDHVTNIDELPANEWSTVHWGQPNCQAASTWVNADGTEVGYTGPTDVITSEAYGFTYTPKIELRPTVNSCLEIVRKYNNALLSGYLDPEEALPLFRSELRAAGIDKVMADKQYQLERWKAKNS